jgi:hypothetical protein
MGKTLIPVDYPYYKAASAVTKEFPKATNTHSNSLLKATGIAMVKSVKNCQRGCQKPIHNDLLVALENSFVTAPAAF